MSTEPMLDDPRWKQLEESDLRAMLSELPVNAVCNTLRGRALEAYERYGLAPIVAWAAKRAWAQGTPGDFWAIFHNHRQDIWDQLRAQHA